MTLFKKPTRKVEKIFVHCSDSDVKSHDNLETIRKWHVEQNGWSDIGYNYFITKDGIVHEARPVENVPAAQKNHNRGSIAICLSGRNEFSKKQFESLRRFCREILKHYDKPLPIFGHKDVDPKKSCPNFDVKEKVGLDENNILILRNTNKMALPILALAAPFAKMIGKKLSKKAAEAVLKKVKEKTGIEIKTKSDAAQALDVMKPEDIKEIELAAIDANRQMFRDELKYGEDLEKSIKDDFVTFAIYGFLFFIVSIFLFSPESGEIIIKNIKPLFESYFGLTFMLVSISAVGLRQVAFKVAEGFIKKYS